MEYTNKMIKSQFLLTSLDKIKSIIDEIRNFDFYDSNILNNDILLNIKNPNNELIQQNINKISNRIENNSETNNFHAKNNENKQQQSQELINIKPIINYEQYRKTENENFDINKLKSNHNLFQKRRISLNLNNLINNNINKIDLEETTHNIEVLNNDTQYSKNESIVSRRNSNINGINTHDHLNTNPLINEPYTRRNSNVKKINKITNLNSLNFNTDLFKMNFKQKINKYLRKKSLNLREAREQRKIDPITFRLDKQTDFQFMGEVESNWSLWNNLYIKEESLLCFSWTIIILVIMIFHIVIFPFVTFSEKEFSESNWQVMLTLFMEWLFILDIGFNFFTSFKNSEGIEIKALSLIAEQQIKTWFFLDLISSIPIDNMQYFGLLQNDIGTVYLRLLKLPKQLRIFRIWLNIFTNKLSDAIMFSDQISISNSQFQMQINAMKQIILFVVISNNLVCQMVSFTHLCDSVEYCSNWQQELAQKEFNQSIKTNYSQYHAQSENLISNQSIEEAELKFQNYTMKERYLVYENAWQFVLQSVTTVGQGDIGTFSTDERIFRSICMCVGVALFTLASSSILETSINESLNIYSSKENEIMIEKMQFKQGLRGDARRYIGLLGDSVLTDQLRDELKFARMLPRQMCECVLKHIHLVQKNKFPVLGDEDLNLFIEMMEVSQFRRCVFDEIVQSEENKISIVYTGQVGASFPNSNQYTLSDQLQYMRIGDEIGFKNYITFDETNVIYSCISNSELVEINSHKFFRLIFLHSIKGVSQIFEKIQDQLMNFYLILSLQQGMLMQGFQIDLEWQKKVMIFLSFDLSDIEILNKLQYKQRNLIRTNDHISMDDKVKWYDCILDPDTSKIIKNKIRICTYDLLKDKYKDQYRHSKLASKITKSDNLKFNRRSGIYLKKEYMDQQEPKPSKPTKSDSNKKFSIKELSRKQTNERENLEIAEDEIELSADSN